MKHRAPTTLVGACNVAFDPSQEWSLIRYGVYPNQVGLQVFDRAAAESMVSSFNSATTRLAQAFRGLPGYIGHPDDAAWLAKNPTARRAAVSRVKELRLTDEGLQFRAAYNDDGKKLLTGDAPAFDAFSPRWGMQPIVYQGRQAFRPVELYSVGYTNHPNIPGSYIGLNEALPPISPMNNDQLIKLLATLGITLARDADAATTDAALTEGQTKAQALVDAKKEAQSKLTTAEAKATTAANELTTIKAQLTDAQGKLATAANERATERTARADLLLATAINEGRITAAQQADWRKKLVEASNEGFATVSGELHALKPAINTASKTAGLGARRGQANPEAKARITAINEAVAARMKSTGEEHHPAYLAVKREKPELFTPASE